MQLKGNNKKKFQIKYTQKEFLDFFKMFILERARVRDRGSEHRQAEEGQRARGQVRESQSSSMPSCWCRT